MIPNTTESLSISGLVRLFGPSNASVDTSELRTVFRIFSDNQALGNLSNVSNYDPRVQRWTELLTASWYMLHRRKGTTNDNVDMLARPLLPAADKGRTGHTRHLYARQRWRVHDPRERPIHLVLQHMVLLWVDKGLRSKVRSYRAPHLPLTIFAIVVGTCSELAVSTSTLLQDYSQFVPSKRLHRRSSLALFATSEVVRKTCAVFANSQRRISDSARPAIGSTVPPAS